MGLALATLLAKRGAHVSIVARDPEKLKSALQELEVSNICSFGCLAAWTLNVHVEGAKASPATLSRLLLRRQYRREL